MEFPSKLPSWFSIIVLCVCCSNRNLFGMRRFLDAGILLAPCHLHVESDAVRKKISLTNDFQQAGERYYLLSKVDQHNLVDDIVDSLGKANKQIQQRMLQTLLKATPNLANALQHD
jgi:hypothetical protein